MSKTTRKGRKEKTMDRRTAINEALRRGWTLHKSVEPTEDELKVFDERGGSIKREDGREIAGIAQSDTNPSVYIYTEELDEPEQADILLAPYPADAIRSPEDREFEDLLESLFDPVPDQYVQGIAVRI